MHLDDEKDLAEFLQWWRADGEDFLRGLARRVAVKNRKLDNEYLELSNVHLVTSAGMVTSTTVTVDSQSGSGWQWPIQSTGQSKCIMCDQLNDSYHIICEECRNVVAQLRTFNINSLYKVMEVLGDPRLTGLFEMLTVDQFRTYLEEAIGDIAGD